MMDSLFYFTCVTYAESKAQFVWNMYFLLLTIENEAFDLYKSMGSVVILHGLKTHLSMLASPVSVVSWTLLLTVFQQHLVFSLLLVFAKVMFSCRFLMRRLLAKWKIINFLRPYHQEKLQLIITWNQVDREFYRPMVIICSSRTNCMATLIIRQVHSVSIDFSAFLSSLYFFRQCKTEMTWEKIHHWCWSQAIRKQLFELPFSLTCQHFLELYLSAKSYSAVCP